MTSATSAPSRRNFHRRSRHRRAFTLTELLVVMGIIVALAGILLPMVIKSYSQSNKTRVAADLQTISIALEAYKQDFGTYPVVNWIDTDLDGTRDAGEYSEWGAAVLCKALIGPGGLANDPAVYPTHVNGDYFPGTVVRSGADIYVCIQVVFIADSIAVTDTNYWNKLIVADGLDGSGFRVGRRDDGPNNTLLDADDIVQGRSYGPYVQPDRFKVGDMAILDRQKQPILYFPASTSRPNINVAPNFVDRSSTSLYDADDNLTQFKHFSFDTASEMTRRIQAMLGDFDFDGAIGAGETAATTGDYLLWTAGSDQRFGTTSSGLPTPSDVKACDDVTNFR